MSRDIKQDIEDEIGRNGWRLVGKIVVPILTAMAVMSVSAAFAFVYWRAEITTSLENHVALGGHPGMEVRMNEIEGAARVRDEKLASIARALDRIETAQAEIKAILRSEQSTPRR